jgi:hypothetical protein
MVHRRKGTQRRRRAQRTRKQRGGTSALPVTTWGSWAQYPGALAWGNGTSAPPPLANGGQYTAPQSTGAWASAPFPATLYGWQVEAARTAGNPDVFYHQRPNDNSGASFSPYVGTPLSPLHYAAMYKPATTGGKRSRKQK